MLAQQRQSLRSLRALVPPAGRGGDAAGRAVGASLAREEHTAPAPRALGATEGEVILLAI